MNTDAASPSRSDGPPDRRSGGVAAGRPGKWRPSSTRVVLRRFDLRWLIVFLSNLLLWWLAGVANHYLAAFSIHLYPGGLLIVYAALQVDRAHGFAAIVLTGLMLDATQPVPPGTNILLLGLIHATLLYGRQRFPRESVVFGIVVALLANLFLFIAMSFLLVGANPRPAAVWLRLFGDLLASQVVLGFITPWFLAMQARAMALAQIHPGTGRRVVL